MAGPTPSQRVSEGMRKISGLYGAAYEGTNKLMDVLDVTVSVSRNQITVPLLGQLRQGLKYGLQTRSGTMQVQKQDTFWEMRIWASLGMTDDDRRAARDAGQIVDDSFSMILEYNDPYALGVESWRLDGCLLWDLPLGFTFGDALVDRQFTFTYELEWPLRAFRAVTNDQGFPIAQYYPVPNGAIAA